jgi:hypothetical protein
MLIQSSSSHMTIPALPSAPDPDALRQRALTLHGDVHASLQEQFAALLTDLQQLRRLLGDATAKLSLAFQTMIHQSKAQRAAAGRLEAAMAGPEVREIRDLADEITRGSVMVIQSLQFEDMASQLLVHVDRRLAWLEAYAKDAAPLGTAVSAEVVGLTKDAFTDMEQRLAQHRQELSNWSRKAVQQESLDEGDIELF